MVFLFQLGTGLRNQRVAAQESIWRVVRRLWCTPIHNTVRRGLVKELGELG